MIGVASILPVVNGEAKITSKQAGSSSQVTDFSAVVALLLGGAQKSETLAGGLLSSASRVSSKSNTKGDLPENSSVNSVISQLIAAVTKEQTIDFSQLKVAGVKVSPENLTPKGVVNLIQSLQLLLKQTQAATKQNSSTGADLSQWESLLSDLQAGKSILAKISLPEGEVSLLFLSNSVDPKSNEVNEQQLDSDKPAFTLLLMPPVANTIEQQELIKRTGFSKISLAEFDYKSSEPAQVEDSSEGAKTTAVDPLIKSLIALAKQEDLTPIQIEKLISKLKTQLSRAINSTSSDVDSTASVSPEVINNIIARVIQAFNDEQSLQTDPKFKEIITKLFSGADDNKAIQQLKQELATKSNDDPSLTMVINTKKSEVNIVQVSDYKGEVTEQKLVTPFASAYNNDSELKQALSAIKEIFENSDKNIFNSVVDATALKPAKTKVEIDTNGEGVKTVVLNFKSGESPVASKTNAQTSEQLIKEVYTNVKVGESAPVAAQQSSETKPVEVKTGEVKASEAKQSELKQAEVKNVEAKPSPEIKSGEEITKEEFKPQTTTKPTAEVKPNGITQSELKQAEVVIKQTSPEAVKTTEQAIKGAYTELEPAESAPVAAQQSSETKPVEVKTSEVKASEAKQSELKQAEVKNVAAKPSPEIKSGEEISNEEFKPQTTTKQTTEVKHSEQESSETKVVQDPKPEPTKQNTKVDQGEKVVKEEVFGKYSTPTAAQKESVLVEKSAPNLAESKSEELTKLKEVSEVNSLSSEEIKIVAAVYEKSGKRQLKIAVNDEVISQKIENFIKEQPIIKNFEVRVVRPEGQVTGQENQTALKPTVTTTPSKNTSDSVEKATAFATSEQSSLSNTNSGSTNKDQSFSTFAQTPKTEALPREIVELRELEITKSSRAHEIIPEVSKFLQKKDANRLTLLLEPETLGKVKVVLSVIDDSMKARIEVENNTVKKILESNVNQLLSSNNSNQSVQLTSVQITVAHGDNKQQRQQQHQQPKKKSGGKEFNIESKPEVNEPSKSMGYNTYDYIV